MTRTEKLEANGWEIWAQDRDERFDSETFVAMDSRGFISVLHFYENGDGERCVDQYFEHSIAETSEDLDVINEDPETFLENFNVVNGAPDWAGSESAWWKM